jgi:hypothetical protein
MQPEWLSYVTTLCPLIPLHFIYLSSVIRCIYGKGATGFLSSLWDDRLCVLVIRVPGYRSRGPGSGFDSQPYHIYWEVVGLERGPLSVVNTIEQLLCRKNSGFGLENRDFGLRDPSCWPRGTLYPLKLALTSPTSGGLALGIVRWRTQAPSFSFFNIQGGPYGSCHLSTTKGTFPFSRVLLDWLVINDQKLPNWVWPTL